MTVTAAKLEANRRNATKSTGPRTSEGKKRSSRNAATHGVFCNDVVLPGECRKEFEAFRHAFLNDLRPLSIVEMMYVDRIVIASWKLKRLNSTEACVTESCAAAIRKGMKRNMRKLDEADRFDASTAQIDAAESQALSFIKQTCAIERIARHAQRLEMSISRAMRELSKYRKETLKRSQSAEYVRAAEAVFLPKVTEVEEEDGAIDEEENEAKGADADALEHRAFDEEKTSGLKPAAGRSDADLSGERGIIGLRRPPAVAVVKG